MSFMSGIVSPLVVGGVVIARATAGVVRRINKSPWSAARRQSTVLGMKGRRIRYTAGRLRGELADVECVRAQRVR